MYRFTSLIVLAAVLFAVGCTEKSTNYFYNQSKVSSLSGTVLPADSGTVIASGNIVQTARISGDGFFTIDSVPPGIYTVTVEPLHYSKRVLRNVLISKSSDYLLRGIALSNYPYPIYRTQPADGATEVGRSSDIYIYADEQLNFEDLSSQALFDPPLDGTWSDVSCRNCGSVEGIATYAFSSYTPKSGSNYGMQLGTTYHVNIPGTVRTLAGAALERDVNLGFSTAPLPVTVQIYSGLMVNSVPISDFHPSLRFPVCVNIDSLNNAVRFEPVILGLWLPINNAYDKLTCSEDNYSSYLVFYATGLLSPDTEYRMIISDQIYLADYVKLSLPDTTEFSTEPMGVTAISPENGSRWVPKSLTVRVRFNTDMDTASVTAAFELREIGGDVVVGTLSWEEGSVALGFTPNSPLRSKGLYRVTILKSAKTAGGVNPKTDFVSYFAVG